MVCVVQMCTVLQEEWGKTWDLLCFMGKWSAFSSLLHTTWISNSIVTRDPTDSLPDWHEKSHQHPGTCSESVMDDDSGESPSALSASCWSWSLHSKEVCFWALTVVYPWCLLHSNTQPCPQHSGCSFAGTACSCHCLWRWWIGLSQMHCILLCNY
jgi:hypothetical protein